MSLIEDITASQYVLDNVTRRSSQASHLLTGASRWTDTKVQRVTQLDALTTQLELRNILLKSLHLIFAVSPLKSIPYTYREELNLGLDLVLFRYSTYRLGSSVGDRFMNLVMRDEIKARAYGMTHISHLVPQLSPSRPLLLLHGLLSIIIPYLVQKILRRSYDENWADEGPSSWKNRATRALQYLQIVWSTLSLINIIHFLSTGQYRTLVERLLGIKMVHGSQKVMRLTNIVYLNQFILTKSVSTLAEVLRFGNIIKKITQSASSIVIKREVVPDNRCCACSELPTISQRSNCGHLYCYYCIYSRLLQSEAEGSFKCLKCDKRVVEANPDK